MRTRGLRITLIGFLAVCLGNGLSAATIFDSIATGDVKKVKAQVEVLDADVNVKNKDGYTPLVFALQRLKESSRREIVGYLVSAKANVNGIATPAQYGALSYFNGKKVPQTFQTSPLVEALWSEDSSLVSLLLEAGANPALELRLCGATNSGGEWIFYGETYLFKTTMTATAMDVANLLKYPTAIKLLQSKKPKLVPKYNLDSLFYLAYSNDLAGFKKRIKAGANPTTYDVAYLIHFGKKEILGFLDAASIVPTAKGFSLSEDTEDLARLSAFIDLNSGLLATDAGGFATKFFALPVDWTKFLKSAKRQVLGESESPFGDPLGVLTYFVEDAAVRPLLEKVLHKKFLQDHLAGFFRLDSEYINRILRFGAISSEGTTSGSVTQFTEYHDRLWYGTQEASILVDFDEDTVTFSYPNQRRPSVFEISIDENQELYLYSNDSGRWAGVPDSQGQALVALVAQWTAAFYASSFAERYTPPKLLRFLDGGQRVELTSNSGEGLKTQTGKAWLADATGDGGRDSLQVVWDNGEQTAFDIRTGNGALPRLESFEPIPEVQVPAILEQIRGYQPPQGK